MFKFVSSCSRLFLTIPGESQKVVRNDDILEGMIFFLSLLRELASNHKDQKDEIDDLMNLFVKEKISKLSVLKTDISRKCKDTVLFSCKNWVFADAKETIEGKRSIEEELLEKRKVCENVLTDRNTKYDDIRNPNGVTNEKEDLHREILMFKTKLETAQSLAEESEEIFIEAKEVAEIAKLQADEKEEEVKLFVRFVDELKCIVNVPEKGGEAEQQQLQIKGLEMELTSCHQATNELHDLNSSVVIQDGFLKFNTTRSILYQNIILAHSAKKNRVEGAPIMSWVVFEEVFTGYFFHRELKEVKAKTGNEFEHHKSNANRSSFQHKQKRHVPSSDSAHAQMIRGEFNNQNSQNFKARPAQSQGSVALEGNGEVCGDGSTIYYKCGQDGHFMKKYPKNRQGGGNRGNRAQSSLVAELHLEELLQ
ncbi:hypothetical protein H5410_030289, partial [Solanum commersonii]